MPGQTILIVDDELTNIKLIKALLAKEGYQFLTAADGGEALAVVKDRIPDLILLDVMMPGIDGFEVCRRLKEKEKFKDIPIIMVTALREKEHKVKAMEVGADDFICKPIDRTELFIRVKSLLRIKSYHDALLKSYHEISQKNYQLRHLEKLKEGLTHMIIHDLNNFLMAISGNLQLMIFEADPNQLKVNRYVSNCQTATAEAADMVHGLLDIHKMEEGKLVLKKKEINLNDLAKAAVAPLEQIAAKNNVAVSFQNSTENACIRGDSGLLKRVMANLLNNALRHTASGDSIEIKIQPDPQNGNVCLSVKDTGDGLPAGYHEKIFEKFEQVNLKEKGIGQGAAGLGLSFCKMAVEAHHGKIWVESEGENKGCTFLVSLPMDADEN